MAKDTVTLQCSCGSTQFQFPPNPKPNDTVTCLKCGATGKYGQLIESAKKQIVDKLTRDLGKTFKGFKLK